jgi:hypothetical protein
LSKSIQPILTIYLTCHHPLLFQPLPHSPHPLGSWWGTARTGVRLDIVGLCPVPLFQETVCPHALFLWNVSLKIMILDYRRYKGLSLITLFHWVFCIVILCFQKTGFNSFIKGILLNKNISFCKSYKLWILFWGHSMWNHTLKKWVTSDCFHT